MSTARVDFTRGAAERIARVVRIVEQGERDQSGPTYGSVIEPPSGKVFRVGSFSTASWGKGQFRTVTFRYVTNTPNTVTAINLFANIGTAASTRACAIARDGTAWHLIAAEC